MNKIPLRHRIAGKCGSTLRNTKMGYFGRQKFLLTCFIYRFLPIFKFDYPRLIEYRFILQNLPKTKGLKVLEVGCNLSLFIYELSYREYETYGIDPNVQPENFPKKIKVVRGDITQTNFPDSFFDSIILISVIEHIGLGYYGDPLHGKGDFLAMNEIHRILKNDGILLITTLIGSKHQVKELERIYGQEELAELLKGWKICREKYYIFQGKWIEVDKQTAFQESKQHFGTACIGLMK